MKYDSDLGFAEFKDCNYFTESYNRMIIWVTDLLNIGNLLPTHDDFLAITVKGIFYKKCNASIYTH